MPRRHPSADAPAGRGFGRGPRLPPTGRRNRGSASPPPSTRPIRTRQHSGRPSSAWANLPPLVTSWEILRLRDELARAGRGEAFVLQGGDCAESFSSNGSDSITRRLKVLLQMSLVLGHATSAG